MLYRRVVVLLLVLLRALLELDMLVVVVVQAITTVVVGVRRQQQANNSTRPQKAAPYGTPGYLNIAAGDWLLRFLAPYPNLWKETSPAVYYDCQLSRQCSAGLFFLGCADLNMM